LIKKINNKISNIYLLVFSLTFYSFDIPWFLIPLLISAISDFFISRHLINKKNELKNIRTLLLISSIFINIGLLIIFKYSLLISSSFGFYSDDLIKGSLGKLILPAGISFYTFQTLSFTIDAYNKKINKLPEFINYLLYVSYFPQLVAGPILRPSEFFNQNSEIKLNFQNSNFNSGINRICYGLFLKLCLADELGIFNDIAYKSNFYELGFLDAWTMAFGFGLQVYFDFSAYSHMAIGVSKIIGLEIKENFNFPYSSTSSTEFWKRWHISLSRWVSDYLYSFLKIKMPLYFYGIIPLLTTWTIMGIWHGSSWRFAMWGFINGILVLSHRIFKSFKFKYFKIIENSQFISWIITTTSLMSTWIYFRSTSWEQANYLFATLFKIKQLDLGLRENYYIFVFVLSIFTFGAGLLNKSNKIKYILNNFFVKTIGTSIALTFAIIFINTQKSFIYFQF
tara:strand:- start:499 stop:1854 length:1356 start_codon:yes stop_codon:yes gene_type:complete